MAIATKAGASPEKLRKLLNGLLAGVSARELKKMQTQFDELESRVTAEEANRMELALKPLVSAKNIRKSVKASV